MLLAHTTQFSSPGWSYLRHGHGVDHLEKGGSIVSLTSPDKTDLTVVIETMVSRRNKLCRKHFIRSEKYIFSEFIKLSNSYF